MRGGFRVALGIVTAVVGAELLLHAQNQPRTAAAPNPTGWQVPRTPDGQPDLQGTWEASEWALVPVHNYKRVQSSNQTGDVPAYWYEHDPSKKQARPFMLVDPPDGRIPIRPEAAKTARPDEWSDDTRLDNIQTASELDQWGRCITRGPIPLIPTSYNAGYQIVQTPRHLAVFSEMIHETRIIHLDGRPHPPKDVRLWLGDSRGRWEGDTLVVDITNFGEPAGRLLPEIFKTGGAYTGPGESLRLTERFTRTDEDTIEYRVTVEDPTTYARPWTLAFPLKRAPEYEIYEYACHEANYFVTNVLSAARAREKAQGSGKK